MSKKIIKPLDPLIFEVAGQFAAIFYEAGRSSGMTSKFKTPQAFAKKYIERFVPLAVEHLLSMLKTTSGLTEHMKARIYEALINPINDPELMDGKKNGLPDINAELIANAMKAYDKNKINVPIEATKKSYKDILLETANPFTPKVN